MNGHKPPLTPQSPGQCPPDWRSVPLSTLLTDDQIEGVLRIIGEGPDMFSRTVALRAYLKPFAAQLASKGVDSDYLAFALVFGRMRLLNAGVTGPGSHVEVPQ